MKFALVLLGLCAFYLVNATGDLEAELDASELQALEETQDLLETPLELLDAEALEEARFRWGNLFKAAKKLFKTAKRLSKNKNLRKAVKFGVALAKDLKNGEEREDLVFMGETPLESLSAEELEEARIKWGKLFSKAKKLYKKLSKNQNLKNAIKFGVALAKDLKNGEAREDLDFVNETPFESMSAEELEAARFRWGSLFKAAKRIFKTAKRLSKNKNLRKAVKFGVAVAKDMQNGEAREDADFIGEMPLESLSAEELEEARIKWGKLFSKAKRLYKKLSKNQNLKNAIKFGVALAKDLKNGEAREDLDLVDETPFQSMSAEELEEARIKWGKLFSKAKKLYKKLSKNQNLKNAIKFGVALAKDLKNGEAREDLDFVDETPFESMSAEELEEARIKWGKLFSAAKKLYKKLSKNKNLKNAIKFGVALAKDLKKGEAREDLDFVDETPFESLSAEELEEARIKWGKLFSAAKKLYKKLSKNKNLKNAIKFGVALAKDLKKGEARDDLDFVDETPFESLSAEELEEERIKWGKLFSAAKKLWKKGKRLYKNKNLRKALKFGVALAKDLKNGDSR